MYNEINNKLLSKHAYKNWVFGSSKLPSWKEYFSDVMEFMSLFLGIIKII